MDVNVTFCSAVSSALMHASLDDNKPLLPGDTNIIPNAIYSYRDGDAGFTEFYQCRM